MSQVVTANRLRDGVVVFLSPACGWVETIAEAAVHASAEATAAALGTGRKDEDGNVVLDVYAIDVAERNGAIVPLRLREAIRAVGPTVHPEHGKPTPPAAR